MEIDNIRRPIDWRQIGHNYHNPFFITLSNDFSTELSQRNEASRTETVEGVVDWTVQEDAGQVAKQPNTRANMFHDEGHTYAAQRESQGTESRVSDAQLLQKKMDGLTSRIAEIQEKREALGLS